MTALTAALLVVMWLQGLLIVLLVREYHRHLRESAQSTQELARVVAELNFLRQRVQRVQESQR